MPDYYEILAKSKQFFQKCPFQVFHNQRFPAKIVVDNNLKIRMVVQEAADGSLIFYKCQNIYLFFFVIRKIRLSDIANPNRLTSEPHNWVEYLRVPPDDRALTL